MYNVIWVIFKHRVRNDEETLEKQHDAWPRNGLCTFWHCLDKYDDKKRLPHVFVEELNPLFTRSSEELINRCLQGPAQNQNETANQVLWTKCPKTKFCGRTKDFLAVTETVSHFNTGAASTATLLKAAVVIPSETDIIRIKKAAINVSEKVRLSLRKLRATK